MKSSFRNMTIRPLRFASGIALGTYWIVLVISTHLPPEVLFRHFSSAEVYLEDGGDKLVHLLAYAGLSFLFAGWLWIRGDADHRLWRITAIALGGYAVLDEVSQIPFRRTANVRDCLADWAGIAIGILCFLFVRVWIERLGIRRAPSSIETP